MATMTTITTSRRRPLAGVSGAGCCSNSELSMFWSVLYRVGFQFSPHTRVTLDEDTICIVGYMQGESELDRFLLSCFGRAICATLKCDMRITVDDLQSVIAYAR